MRVAAIVSFLVVACSGEDPQCRFDVDCPIEQRCVAQTCLPVVLEGNDASVGQDAGIGLDAGPGLDSGQPELDAGADGSVPQACTLALVGANDVENASSPDNTPFLVRSGRDLFGVAFRGFFDNPVAVFVDATGTRIGELAPLSGGIAREPVALAAAADGTLVAAWVEDDERVHAASYVGAGDPVLLPAPTTERTGMQWPALARAGNGFVLAWSDASVGRAQVWTRALDAMGNIVVGLEPVRHDTAGVANFPALAGDVVGTIPLTWRDERDGPGRIFGGLRAGDGSVGEVRLSEGEAAQGVSVVQTPYGFYASWVERVDPADPILHVTRVEGIEVTDHPLDSLASLDPLTSIAFNGEVLLVGWHTNSGAGAEARVDALSIDFSSRDTLSLGVGTAAPHIAADDELAGVVWIDAGAMVHFSALECP